MSNLTATIRRAELDDLQQLNNVMCRASLAVETGEVLQQLLDKPEYLQLDPGLITSGQVILAECDGVPIGFASYLVSGSAEAELDGMFVDPKYWRRGVGRLLFEAVEHHLVARQAAGIRVVAGVRAVEFYKSVGFLIAGEAKTALGPVVPVMTKALP
ncbi:MAG TPA: GNAT family N-acetyltransferase [Devosia sp.]|jgi:GNAT superfamily N-acetyltransferase|uniref:GNAT family N-acetyltransferase n=1 Tax=Devosia sp. TaxID=1871048 RepID=UPI002F94B99E